MREYIFRGRDFFGKWHEGYLSGRGELVKIAPKSEYWVDYYVKPETVGQYIGLTDVNGKRIYEGDFVKLFVPSEGDEGVVEVVEEIVLFDFVEEWNAVSVLQTTQPMERQYYDLITQEMLCEYKAVVIGNRFDNPELLGVLK